MENELVLLPTEVKELALKVSEEKQKEVNLVLNQIFAGTADWEKQIDAIEVKSINDTMSIQLADTARKNAKTARLSAEKIFDSKRSEVHERMQDDKLEDALWLKSKQIMQLKFKAIEEKAEWKANYVKRHEAEMKEARTQLRLSNISKFNPEINRIEVENLSDEMFNLMLSALEKEHNDRIVAEKKAEDERIEKERINKLHQDRKNSILHLWNYVDYNLSDKNFGEYSETAWQSILNQLNLADKKEKEHQEKVKKENERLKKEAEQKEKQRLIEIEKDRKEHEANMKAAHEERGKALKEEAEKREKLQAEREKEAKESAILQAMLNAENQAKERELKALKDAEQKEKQRLLDAEQKRIKEEKSALLAPDKDKLLKFAEKLDGLILPELKSIEAAEILKNIVTLISKTTGYIKEKAESL